MSQEQRLNSNQQQLLDLEEIVVPIEGDEASPPPETPAKEDESLQRPDPTFKRVVEKGVEEWKVGSGPTELKTKQLTSADLFLEVPPDTNLQGSPFEFFWRYNIIEFKSRNDQLTYGKYKAQLSRVLMWSSEHEEVADTELLNVIVSARKPEALFSRLAERGREFTQLYDEVGGIYIERSEMNDVILVVCSELPVEPKYAIWLLFAAPTTEQWRAAIRMMAENGMIELLEEAERLNPKEYRAMSSDIKERLRHYKPEEMAEVMQAIQELTEDHLLNDLGPEQRLAVLSKLSNEERLKGLPTEEIIRAITPEEVAEVLSPEEQQVLRKLQEKLGQPKPTDDAK